MHIVVFFINIGSYHAARLRATDSMCQLHGWRLTAVQATDDTLEHPWGDLAQEITFPLKTLVPQSTTTSYTEKQAASLVPSCLHSLQADVVVIPGWGFPISQAALAWCKRHHIPAILMSETKWDDETRQWWKEYLKYWLYIRKFSAALVGGKVHHDYLVKLGFPRDRIFYGYDAVDNDYFARQSEIARSNPTLSRQRQPQIPSKPYFIVLTRLLKRKNIHRLVEAFAIYRQQVDSNEAWDLVICGTGEEANSISQLIDEFGIAEYVHLPGFIPYQALGDWYGLAGAFVHPALVEPWGLVVNEACAAGLPIICSQTVGAASELVENGRNGFLFDPKNITDMTNTLTQISKIDTETRIQMGKFSQQIVANYSPENFAIGIIQAIDKYYKKIT